MVVPTKPLTDEGVEDDEELTAVLKCESFHQVYHVPTGLFINNEFRRSIHGKKFPIINPANGEQLMEVFEADKDDVQLAVVSARIGFAAWRNMNSSQRGVYMNKLADLMSRDKQKLAELESLNNGKPLADSLENDIPFCIDLLRYHAGWCDKNPGQVLDAKPGYFTLTINEPYGVVGQIVPWNFPICNMIIKIAPAIATGNTVVLKTSEKTPMTALVVCELIKEAGFPPGVINVLSGFGAIAGDAIARHPGIAKVAFTGSTATGRLISIAAAESNLKKVSLELGGKSPNIVFADADLDQAAEIAARAIFSNAGQICCAGSRLFLHRDIYDTFLEKLTAIAKGMTLGSQFDASTKLGPVVDRIQYDRVLEYLKLGADEGATVHYGGCSTDRSDGFYIKPTIFTNVADDSRIAQEEIFGPVVCVFKFDTLDEVMKRANATTYGLGAAIHTKNLDMAIEATQLIQAGTVWVNTYGDNFPTMPFGGYKQSGSGRDNGQSSIQEYTQVKSVYVKVNLGQK